MQKDDARILLFATIICVTCSLMLATAAVALRGRQEMNVVLDQKINVLQAFGEHVKDERGKKIVGPAEVEALFQKHITEVIIDAETGAVVPGLTSATVPPDELDAKTKLRLYLWKDGGEVTRYAFPISGRGLWSTIYGFVALDRDLATILGITFYKHGETPGLGAECEKPWFQKNFSGKRLWADGQLLPFRIWKGHAPQDNDHAVDGISGATITGNGITQFLNADMARYEKYFGTIRKG